jgi:hypothetical protein
VKSIWRENPNGSTYWPSVNAREAEMMLGITRIYYPILRKDELTGYWIHNDIEINQQFAKDISTRFEFGLYYHPEAWDGDRNAISIVNKMDHAFQLCNPYVKGVMWDIEDHFVNDRVCAIVDLWRGKHPTGAIAWTQEPFQAGWMNDNLVKKVNSDTNMVIVVQDFFGDMTPAGTRNGISPKQELLNKGFAANRVKVFYDGKRVNEWKNNWDGCILSEERLPSYNT